MNVEPIEPKRLAFLDNTEGQQSDDALLWPGSQSEQAESSTPDSWKSVTVIAAMGLSGNQVLLAFAGAVDATKFLKYVKQVLTLCRGDKVIFNSLASDHSPTVSEAI